MAKKVPVQFESVPFRNHTILALKKDEVVYVAFKDLCKNVGLAYESQFNRVKRDELLSETISKMNMVAADGVARDVTVITMEGVINWLAGVSLNHIKDEKKRKVLKRYKMECWKVLSEHFLGRANRAAEKHIRNEHGSVGPAYHDFQPPRTAPGEIEVYSPPATLADLAAFAANFQKDFTAQLSANMPEILKHAMESGGKRSFMSQWRDKTRAYIAETVAEDVAQVDDDLDEMRENLEKVRDRIVDLESAQKKLTKKISADKGLSSKVKRQMMERLDAIEDDIATLKRVIAPAKKKKATNKSKKRVLN